MPERRNPMTEKQKRFCDEYLIDRVQSRVSVGEIGRHRSSGGNQNVKKC